MLGSDLVLRIATKGFGLANAKLKALGKEGALAGAKLGKFAKVGGLAVVGALAGITKGLIDSVQAFVKFESEMTQSLAIMRTTVAQQEQMALVARQVATETTIGATQSAEAYFFLASAGLDAEQSMKALPQVAKFSQAGMFDMATATDLATDAQSALGLTVKDAQQNLTNLTRVTDVLVKANTLANASVMQFSESLTNKAGAQIKVVNKDIEEGVAVLAAFADAGVKGAAGGEKLNQIIRDIPRAARRNQEAFKALNLEMFDSEGNMKNLADIIEELDNVFAPMSDALKASTLDQLGLNRGVADAVKILSGTTDRIREYEAELRKAGGTTDLVAKNQMQSLDSQMKVLSNQIENLQITIAQNMVPALNTFIEHLQLLAERTQNFKNRLEATEGGTKKFKLALIGIAAVLGPLFPVATAVALAIGAIGRVIVNGNKAYKEAQEQATRLTDAYKLQQQYTAYTVRETVELEETFLSLEDILDGTNYTVAELTQKFEENGIAMNEDAQEAMDLAKAYDKSLLPGLQKIVSAYDRLEAIQDRIDSAEKGRNKALKDQIKAEKEVERATSVLSEARKRYADVQGLGEQVTQAEELAILNQREEVNRLTEALDGSRIAELELGIAKERLAELIKESTAISREEEQALRDIERAEADLTRAEDLRTQAIQKVKEAQEELNKVTEKSTRNILEQAIAQKDLQDSLGQFGPGTKAFADAMAQMSSVIGEDLDFLIGKFDETFKSAEKLSRTKIYKDTVETPTTPSRTTFPNTLTENRRADILSRIGESSVTVNVTTGSLLGTEQDVEEAVSKALVQAQKRGISIS